ncbi:hypothetical protein HanRHA438_Chr02g0062341 [Helianthus annuus]|nr:hypothetical protein HanIR_Chr02g0068171 [Helianthus annuus]KAJ0618474.1 hypothetical protein HanHA89_Chr02g0053711 [Helianthus annuus]KAJ0776924.1 hypothetical protein HanLR1_Chr02g0051291 [Helianthus annuus]KAJ0805100.1 hypothetical protein HanPI659440_Chr02g0045791 [Helianthus annuus]KAJ0939546.1 hypothetical protein HanRHA438_Chr02g0062341 [Helianthus annuus]
MATSLPTPLPNAQQPEEQEPIVQGQVQSSGSIGPFFVVMSIMMVVAILSCVVGRIYSRRAMEEPLDRVTKRRDCFGWVKGRLWRCAAGGCGGHVITLAGKEEAKGEGVV